ncbi:MAG: hypothetical protein MJY69_08425 [Bacteroidales bacterium]|nr:hypothetical protein [Bacteroidales bacterium]
MMQYAETRKISIISGILLTMVASGYYFPVGFHGLPETLNSKQILAVLGVFLFVARCVRENSAKMDGSILKSFLFAAVFSLWCYFCCVYNNTSDYAYAFYIGSFAVWLGGAFALCEIIKFFHGTVNLELVTRYLVLACVAQCALVLLVDNVPAVQNFVDFWFVQGTRPKEVGRLYGIGCSLDSGGVRFACVLVLIAHQFAANPRVADSKLALSLYLTAFMIIAVIGNMVARTTTVGLALGLAYIAVSVWIARGNVLTARQMRFRTIFSLVLALAVIVVFYYYTIDPGMRKQIRFAFEMFFNYVETGEFRTSSSDVLMERMWIWPWTQEGWVLGYGSFEWDHFYALGKQTDIGYCRFTLYCGLVGLVLFSIYFIYNSTVVMGKFRNSKMLGWLLLAMTFVIWLKVSTDIFQLYALLFCLPSDKVPEE